MTPPPTTTKTLHASETLDRHRMLLAVVGSIAFFAWQAGDALRLGTGRRLPWLPLVVAAGALVWSWLFVRWMVVVRRYQRTAPAAVLAVDDERVESARLHAFQAALLGVCFVQVPFFWLDVPAPALARLSLGTGVAVAGLVFAWRDREAA
jgi:hypothetical protein